MEAKSKTQPHFLYQLSGKCFAFYHLLLSAGVLCNTLNLHEIVKVVQMVVPDEAVVEFDGYAEDELIKIFMEHGLL